MTSASTAARGVDAVSSCRSWSCVIRSRSSWVSRAWSAVDPAMPGGGEEDNPPAHVNEQFAKDYASDCKQLLVTYKFEDGLDELQLKTILFEKKIKEQEEVVMSGIISEVRPSRAKEMGLEAGDQVLRIDDWRLPPTKHQRHAKRAVLLRHVLRCGQPHAEATNFDSLQEGWSRRRTRVEPGKKSGRATR